MFILNRWYLFVKMEDNGKNEEKRGGFFGSFQKDEEFFKKNLKIFQKPIALFDGVLYNKTIAVGENGAKCSEVLRKSCPICHFPIPK